MRFMEKNNIVSKSLFLLFAVIACQSFVACQTKEQKIAAALKQCQEMLDKNDIANIGNCYIRVMTENPESAEEISKRGSEAVFKKCLDFKDKKDFENAIICLEGVVGVRGESANVHFQLADSYLQYYKQKYVVNSYQGVDLLDKAELEIKKSLEINPNKAIVYEVYGEILKNKNDLQGALKKYKKATELKPEDSFYFVKLALTQEKLNDSTGAIESYKSALAVNPKDTTALYFLGALYEKLGKFNEAIETFEKQKTLESLDEETEQRLRALKERQEQPKKKSKAAGRTVRGKAMRFMENNNVVSKLLLNFYSKIYL